MIKKKKFCIELSEAERELIFTLLVENGKRGDYYGNRQQYTARLERLISRIVGGDGDAA
jgi:hypothetical protein